MHSCSVHVRTYVHTYIRNACVGYVLPFVPHSWACNVCVCTYVCVLSCVCVCLCFHRFHAVGVGRASAACASVNRDTLAPSVRPVSTRRYVQCTLSMCCECGVELASLLAARVFVFTSWDYYRLRSSKAISSSMERVVLCSALLVAVTSGCGVVRIYCIPVPVCSV